jgi:pyruvate-ferredoxin/flavodoxin oxidoreductase
MSTLRNHAIRWYRKVFGAPTGSDIRDEGLDCVLDGNSAVALSEATIATHAVVGSSSPAKEADTVWLSEVEQNGTNLFGEVLSAQATEGPRGVIAAATGLALAGKRVTAFLSGTDIAAGQDLLISAAGKHVPLVLHVGTRATVAHGATLGSGHETVHLSADAGCFVLFAANVQEAVDFTYIARRVSEESLVPGMVVMDGEQTALAPQDVRLLSPAQVSGITGAAREQMPVPTAAQKLLFGETRRRVPAWHDLNEPVLTGALFDKDSFALGAFARRPFFDAFVAETLSESFSRFAAGTGRQHESVSHYRMDDASTVLVTQGAAIETARVAADCLRKDHKIKAGVLGIHALRPFPEAEIATALEGRDTVFVLERTTPPLSGEPPLTREIRAGMERLDSKRRPRCTPVNYGLGGLPLRVADLVELCQARDALTPGLLFLGLSFDDRSGTQPKREVMLDALRRDYPNAAGLGILAQGDAATSKPKNSLIIEIRRGNTGNDIVGTAGALLHALDGGRVRARPAVSWQRWSGVGVDWLIHGDDSLHDPGDDLVSDVTLDVPAAVVTTGEIARTFRIPLDNHGDEDAEKLLGGLFGTLIKSNLLDHKLRRVIAARKGLLKDVEAGRSDNIMAAFQAGLEQLVEVDYNDFEPAVIDPWEGEAPAAVRHLDRDDDTFASLPRFWDQTGVLYRDGQADRLTAEPFLATGTMPPLSSTFNDTSKGRNSLPAFDSSLCTGCGKCWIHCPDSAIGVVAATPAALIDAGISQTGADAVRQVSAKLATRMISSNKKADVVATTFGELLNEAYSWLGDKMPLPDDRKQAIQEGISDITTALGELPVSITRPFFHDAEAAKKDGAELLSLVINPEACKACGICISQCEPEALRAETQDAASLEQARTLWSVYSATPDTPSESMERVAKNPDIGAMAAILLSRYCQFALAGGDPAEAGSGEKIAVNLALAATEFHQQPIVQRFAKTLTEAGDTVAGLINETLSSTFAVEDLDAVTEKLKQTTSPRVDLKDLAEGIGDAATDHSIDTDYLLRLIELRSKIESAQHRLVEGEHGLGRARYGLAVAGGSTATWAGAFPHNPFQAPVVIDMTGDAAQLTAGLVEGHLDETTDLVRLLRQARLEVDRPDGLDWKREVLAKLHWRDLEEDELNVCPPLILIGSDEMLAGQGLSQLIWLLNSGLPVKALVLSELDFGINHGRSNNPRGQLALLGLGQRNAYVAQTSIANPEHFGESMLQALDYDGPALLQVYAPSPTRHGFDSNQTVAMAELAAASRALPLFRYDPRAEGVFGSRISLDGNPATDELRSDVTFADWARGQARFASHFSEQDEVSQALDDAAEECLANWQTLQELAGITTPFTERLEQQIRAELAAEHQAALDAQKQASADEIREIRETTQAEIAQNIRSRLLQLASRKRN